MRTCTHTHTHAHTHTHTHTHTYLSPHTHTYICTYVPVACVCGACLQFPALRVLFGTFVDAHPVPVCVYLCVSMSMCVCAYILGVHRVHRLLLFLSSI